MCILPQSALRRDCNGKCIELIEGHYLEVVVEVYVYFILVYNPHKMSTLSYHIYQKSDLKKSRPLQPLLFTPDRRQSKT